MFKNLIPYCLVSNWTKTAAEIEAAIESMRFAKCGSTQEKSIGWIEPRGHENGPLVEVVGGQFIMKLMIETKAVPSRAVADKVAEHVKEIEVQTGRKPGKKEKRELADEVRQTLLPMAFTKARSVMVWIDPKRGLVVLDAGTPASADEVTTCLVKAIDGFTVAPMSTHMSPAGSMAMWLSTKEAPQGFTVDREVELRATDETKAVVRYSRHNLDTDEIGQHIAAGKLPTKLALTWNDRVSFVLTDALQLKKVLLLDVVLEGAGTARDGKEDAFDADVAIATGELSQLLPDLFDALGGAIAISEDEVREAEAPKSDDQTRAVNTIAKEQADKSNAHRADVLADSSTATKHDGIDERGLTGQLFDVSLRVDAPAHASN